MGGATVTKGLSKIHWVRDDEGPDYCADCAEVVARESCSVVDGGMDIYETDSPARCYRCGRMLACDVVGGPTILTAAEWDRAE
jgi:hypothetical protein